MQFHKSAMIVAAVLSGLAAADASAQTYSGGHQGQNGRGYSYTATKSGSSVTGSVQTNKGYGATGSHSTGVNAYGVTTGTSTVSTNNGSSVTTHASGINGYAAGTITATGPSGQSASGGGAIYVPN